jgi:hypothetical protein
MWRPTTMTALRLLALPTVALVGLALYSEPAMARYCFTQGSFPNCGVYICPRNFVEVWTSTKGCLFGQRTRCCEVMAHIKQSQKRPIRPVPPSYGSSTLKKNKSYKGIFK